MLAAVWATGFRIQVFAGEGWGQPGMWGAVWPDLAKFCQLGYFRLLFYSTNLYLNKQFPCIVCYRYFKVSNVVWCRCFGLSNKTLMRIFWHFWPLCPKIGRHFNQFSGHTAGWVHHDQLFHSLCASLFVLQRKKVYNKKMKRKLTWCLKWIAEMSFTSTFRVK